jgi:hypothetical protein
MENAVNTALINAFGYLPEHTKRNWVYILAYAYNGEVNLMGYPPSGSRLHNYNIIARWPVGAWNEARTDIAGSVLGSVAIKDYGPVAA